MLHSFFFLIVVELDHYLSQRKFFKVLVPPTSCTKSVSLRLQEKVKRDVSPIIQKNEVKNVDEEKCAQCGTLASRGAGFCAACGENLKRKSSPIEQQPQSPPTYNLSLIHISEPTRLG